MIRSLATSLILISLLTSWSGVHPFHVSVTTANYRTKTATLEIEIKTFTDDLTKAIKEHSGKELKTDMKEIGLYFSEKLKIANAGTGKLEYVGMESEYDITFIYLQIENFQASDVIRVSNSAFFELFEDQTNIVNVKIEDELQSAFLTVSEPVKNLRF